MAEEIERFDLIEPGIICWRVWVLVLGHWSGCREAYGFKPIILELHEIIANQSQPRNIAQRETPSGIDGGTCTRWKMGSLRLGISWRLNGTILLLP